MISILRRLFRCTSATAAVEAAIFTPVLLIFTLGVIDLGSGMFLKMTVDAVAQAGASYAVINYSAGSSPTCASLTQTCINDIEAAMTDAAGGLFSCSARSCPVSFTSCTDNNGGICFSII